MVSGDRQRVIETNRSLRLIKNELESLLEKGVITDDTFDTISNLLPAESSLSSGPSRSQQVTPALASARLPTPASSTTPSSPFPTPAATATASAPVTAPPSYAQSTAVPPALPVRNQTPAAPPEKPVLAHARALYRYAATDARDCSFDKDDRIAVYEYMNDDWWMGRNQRTGEEGIFPRSYVHVDAAEDEKKQHHQQLQPYQPPVPGSVQYATGAGAGGGYPPPPPPGQGYQHGQQPGQEGEGSGSKMGEHGKKFGKKLGNAAIFGAGATIGSNIVNSIF
ncbi:protein that induces appearance of [PIN+] prion when overproduced [Madurella fahalii]|uniref:Protein that induces appearance of [PIN+] prion when overproduced n=1 Tax=Madurella fahalii TaxID=1157608 RepID=A0ABQ0G1X3_9PEZI